MYSLKVYNPPELGITDTDLRRIFMKGPSRRLSPMEHVETTGMREVMPVIGRRTGLATALQIMTTSPRRTMKLTTLASAIRTAIRMYPPQVSAMGHPVTVETVEKLEAALLVLATHVQMAMQPMDEETAANWLMQGQLLLSTGVPADLAQKFTAIGHNLQEYHRLTKDLRRHYSTGMGVVDTIKAMCMLLPTETPAIN